MTSKDDRRPGAAVKAAAGFARAAAGLAAGFSAVFFFGAGGFLAAGFCDPGGAALSSTITGFGRNCGGLSTFVIGSMLSDSGK